MPFQFSLETLLRLRRSQQRQQEMLVQKANEQVNHLTAELHAVSRRLAEISCAVAAGGISGAELHFDGSRRTVLQASRSRTESSLQQARERHAALAAELRSIWQQREVLETLRQQERYAYTLAEGRREQRRQDDQFLLQKRKR